MFLQHPLSKNNLINFLQAQKVNYFEIKEVCLSNKKNVNDKFILINFMPYYRNNYEQKKLYEQIIQTLKLCKDEDLFIVTFHTFGNANINEMSVMIAFNENAWSQLKYFKNNGIVLLAEDIEELKK
jgi:hypothetical protein